MIVEPTPLFLITLGLLLGAAASELIRQYREGG